MSHTLSSTSQVESFNFDDDLSIQTVKINDSFTILTDDQLINPFFVGITEKKLDAILPKDLYNNFKRVLALCAKNTFTPEDTLEAEKIYNNPLTKTEYINLANYFTLVPMSRNLLHNKRHYR